MAVLHFGVYRTWPTREGDDVAINFRNAEGVSMNKEVYSKTLSTQHCNTEWQSRTCTIP